MHENSALELFKTVKFIKVLVNSNPIQADLFGQVLTLPVQNKPISIRPAAIVVCATRVQSPKTQYFQRISQIESFSMLRHHNGTHRALSSVTGKYVESPPSEGEFH
ncbi:MAG: hypothetical protein L0Y39_07560 [Methylococcaceae bacterium]|nr:hypothetical protein [Methylococcaceae bacterium]MCI0668277.1 hypothetical protein [Methylococcaceae bacterium]